MICTKTYYNYIELVLLDIKNIDLPLKVRRKNSSKKVKENKRVLGRSIDERPNFIDNRNVFEHLISTRWSNTEGGFYKVKLLREIDTVIGGKNKTNKVLLTLLRKKN